MPAVQTECLDRGEAEVGELAAAVLTADHLAALAHPIAAGLITGPNTAAQGRRRQGRGGAEAERRGWWARKVGHTKKRW